MAAYYELVVPGKFAGDVALVDVETWKVPTPDGYRMPNGEVLRKRWAVCLAGVAVNGVIGIVDPEGDEEEGLAYVSDYLEGVSSVKYGASREFDEMILSGRFTNARRAHLPEPVWPAVRNAMDLPWENVGHSRYWPDYPRGEDVASRDVPAAMKDGRWNDVAVHLLRDVAELILDVGEPNARCRRWCERVLLDYDFALDQFCE